MDPRERNSRRDADERLPQAASDDSVLDDLDLDVDDDIDVADIDLDELDDDLVDDDEDEAVGA